MRFSALWAFTGILAASVWATGEGLVTKSPLDTSQRGPNQLDDGVWTGWKQGFLRDGDTFMCDNGPDDVVERGVFQTVVLNQTEPQPFVAVAWSKAEDVAGPSRGDYSLYLDLTYMDGTPLWGQLAPFTAGTHDWERREVVVFPKKPVQAVHFHMLLRGHAGKAWFRNPQLRLIETPPGTCTFDGTRMTVAASPLEGFQVRDEAAGSEVMAIEDEVLGLRLESSRVEHDGAVLVDASIEDTTGKDRAITLYYTVPMEGDGWSWLEDAYTTQPIDAFADASNTVAFNSVGKGALSRYPFGAVAKGETGLALGIDMAFPAVYRIGASGGAGELYLAYDVALTKERPKACLRFCRFEFAPEWRFRSALDLYRRLFPDAFVARIKEQGIWMPFAPISKVEGWEDFGFRFKEGTDETEWDDAHHILTFRYTEPMTWWMTMSPEQPKTMDGAVAEARRLAEAENAPAAKALFTSGFHNSTGAWQARLLDTPWCNGAVWSMNSLPGLSGEFTDFNIKWNPQLRDALYGPGRTGDLDGEYIDSSEGYVTEELDFRRDHFAAAQTPLTWDTETCAPAVFRGLIAFEYVRAIARDVHGMDKFMMANGTPYALCWLAPLLDVLGTETNWSPGGTWSPMAPSELFYRRALCGGKPYCFLMNTHFDQFSHEMVEKYMKRSAAFGMFPGFFSEDAATGHYFSRPELYNRDRDLFRKYIPICQTLAEAGWEPVTLARADVAELCLERFGDGYLTVFNPTAGRLETWITLDIGTPDNCADLVSGERHPIRERSIALTLGPEELAVLALKEQAQNDSAH